MYEHNALGYWLGLALCLTKSEAVEHAVLRQLLLSYSWGILGYTFLSVRQNLHKHFQRSPIMCVLSKNKKKKNQLQGVYIMIVL